MASGENLGVFEDCSAVRLTRSSSPSSCASSSASGSSSNSRSNKSVTHLDIKDVERDLHIFYHDEYLKPSELLNRLPEFGILTEEQRIYSETVKNYLKEINLNTASMHIIQYRPDVFKAVIDGVMSKIMEESEIHIRYRIKGFLRELYDLLNQKNEGNFTSVAAAFASVCCLHAKICFYEGDNVTWKNLRGETVTARPDIRLFKDGVRSEYDHNSMLVSVVKVKQDSWEGSEDLLRAVLESTRLDDSPDSSNDSSEPFPDTYHGRRTVKDHLTKQFLGQHALELLLDLYKCHETAETATLAMPGVIVNGTMVTFTLLEMSNSHFQKLKRNEDLQSTDQATVFYSRPYDIIYDEDRNILIEMFISLNNIEYNKSTVT